MKQLNSLHNSHIAGDQVHCTVGGGNAPKQRAAIKQEEEHSALARDECMTH